MVVGVAHAGDLGQGEPQVHEALDPQQPDEVGHAVLLVAIGAAFRLGEQTDLG
jgi:hypothetical protein